MMEFYEIIDRDGKNFKIKFKPYAYSLYLERNYCIYYNNTYGSVTDRVNKIHIKRQGGRL